MGETRRAAALQKVADATYRAAHDLYCVVCYSFSKKCATFLPASSV